jgi:hypothetical protein
MDVEQYIVNGLVHCKTCPSVIAVRDRTGNVHPNEHYSELVIAMANPDNTVGKHETGACRACRERLLTSPPTAFELDALYARDLLQWREDARTARQPEHSIESMLAPLRARRPIRLLAEEGRGTPA